MSGRDWSILFGMTRTALVPVTRKPPMTALSEWAEQCELVTAVPDDPPGLDRDPGLEICLGSH